MLAHAMASHIWSFSSYFTPSKSQNGQVYTPMYRCSAHSSGFHCVISPLVVNGTGVIVACMLSVAVGDGLDVGVTLVAVVVRMAVAVAVDVTEGVAVNVRAVAEGVGVGVVVFWAVAVGAATTAVGGGIVGCVVVRGPRVVSGVGGKSSSKGRLSTSPLTRCTDPLNTQPRSPSFSSTRYQVNPSPVELAARATTCIRVPAVMPRINR